MDGSIIKDRLWRLRGGHFSWWKWTDGGMDSIGKRYLGRKSDDS